MQSIAHAIPGALADILRAAPLSQGKVDFAWKAAVGPAMGRGTTAKLDGHILTIDAATPAWAREIKRSSHIILSRMQTLLGGDVVRRLDVRSALR